MSNALAIATVTATLQRTLQAVVDQELAGASVTTTRPSAASGAAPSRGVSIFLYQITPNAAWRNEDLPTRSGNGISMRARPRAAFDLHYLFIFSGDETTLEPQRLLGTVVRTMHTQPILMRQSISDTVSNATFSYLANSDLADDIELVRFTPIPMTLEELSKVWSIFFETPYALSVGYLASVVLIEASEYPATPLPVRQPIIYVQPLRHPVIQSVWADGAGAGPITVGSTLIVVGSQFVGEGGTTVQIDGRPTPTSSISNAEIRLPLTAPSLFAGIRTVQVVQPILMGTPAVAHGGFESNLFAFALQPVVGPVGQPTSTTAADGTKTGTLPVTLKSAVGRNQQVLLLLSQINIAGPTIPNAYTFPLKARDPAGPASTLTLTIPFSSVTAGTYLVRLRIDGADSVIDPDPTSPTFGPKVTI